MTKSQRILNATAAFVFLALAASWAGIQWAWTDETIVIALLGGLSWGHAVRTPEDEVLERRNAWLMPVVALAVAVQWTLFAESGDRIRMALLGAGLVLAAVALAWRSRVAQK